MIRTCFFEAWMFQIFVGSSLAFLWCNVSSRICSYHRKLKKVVVSCLLATTYALEYNKICDWMFSYLSIFCFIVAIYAYTAILWSLINYLFISSFIFPVFFCFVPWISLNGSSSCMNSVWIFFLQSTEQSIIYCHFTSRFH